MIGVRGIAEFMKRVDFQDIQGGVKSLTVWVCSRKNIKALKRVLSNG